METIQSRYLKRDFTFTPATMQRNDGPVTIIPHNELWDIIHNQISEKGVTYDYNPVAVTKEHCFIGCTIRDNSGRSITEFGESIDGSLKSAIAKTIPATMAQIRAFDRAAIRYLDLTCDGKVYSDQEIPSSEYSAPVKTSSKKAETPKEQPKEKVAEEKPVEEIVSVPEPTPATEETAASPEPESTVPAEEPPTVEPPVELPSAPKSEHVGTTPPTWKNDNVKMSVLEGVVAHSEIIVFDTETSGLKPSNDRILELAAKKFSVENGQVGSMIDELHIYIKPPFSICSEITELNGISDELLADKPVEEDAFIDIFNFFGENPQIIAAYNTPFDLNFMAALYKRQEKTFAPQCQFDVLDMARDIIKDVPNHKLETVAEYCGFQGDNFHNAQFDTDVTVSLLKRFLTEYSKNSASETGKIQPTIESVTLFDKSATLRRIYVNTNNGTLYFDLVKKVWASKDAKLETIDMDYLEKEAWKFVGVADQAAFEKFKGKVA